jgi:hypothetical protein
MGGNATTPAPADSTPVLPLLCCLCVSRDSSSSSTGVALAAAAAELVAVAAAAHHFDIAAYPSSHGIWCQIFMRRWKYHCCYSCRFLTMASSDLTLLR